MRDIVRQLRTDFRLVPRFVDEYVVHTPREEALKASRQVCGVSHYLSLMATGEVDMRKCALYGVAITCIDEVTDELGEDLYPEAVCQAFMDNPPFEPLEILPVASDAAEHDEFEYAVQRICRAQDASMAQLEDIGKGYAEEITRQKGGWSATANLYMVKADPTDEEKELMWKWGFVMQMLDDYLDQPKDRAAGLSTPYTKGIWNDEYLEILIDELESHVIDVWGESDAQERFFTVCRLHRRLGQVENKTPFRASWFAPGYL